MVAYTTEIPPPGFFIREELEARGWSQRDLAGVLGVPEQAVNMIASGKRGVSADMAKKLGDAFDVSPEFFLNLQRAFDLSRAPEADPGVSKRARFYTHYPIREMAKRGWIASADEAEKIESEMMRFFEVKAPDKIPHMAHAAKKTSYEEIPPAQLAWLFRVRQMAREAVVGRYSRAAAGSAITKLSALLGAPDEARHVPRILAEAGIRYVLVESLPNAKIDGVCFWLDEASPVIGMSLRYDRIDNFWFVLRHELEHVIRGHGRDTHTPMMDSDIESGDQEANEEERLANEAARWFCVPQKEMASFIARKQPYFAEKDMIGFAGRLGLHPGLVAGQLRRQLGRWDLFVKHLVKIRSAVAPNALVDGWGDVAPVTKRGASNEQDT